MIEQIQSKKCLDFIFLMIRDFYKQENFVAEIENHYDLYLM